MSTFEERLFDAVVAQFFAPQWTQIPVINPITGRPEPQMIQQQSAVARVAYEIFTAKHDEILEAVKERLDIAALADALADRIQADVVERMTKSGFWSSTYDRDRDAMRRMINERIADELARRQLARIEAEEVGDEGA